VFRGRKADNFLYLTQHTVDLVRVNLLTPIIADPFLAFQLPAIQVYLGRLIPRHTGIEFFKESTVSTLVQIQKPGLPLGQLPPLLLDTLEFLL